MKIEINIEKRHAYLFVAMSFLFASVWLVNAFGGSTPSVLGHSALELLVNGSSISNNNVTGDHVVESTLGTVPTATTATTATNANACDNDGSCGISNIDITSGSATWQNTASGSLNIIIAAGALGLQATHPSGVNALTLAATGSDDRILVTPGSSGFFHVAGEALFDGISGATTKAVCVKSDAMLGTCSDAVGATGSCTCG